MVLLYSTSFYFNFKNIIRFLVGSFYPAGAATFNPKLPFPQCEDTEGGVPFSLTNLELALDFHTGKNLQTCMGYKVALWE